MKKNTLHTKTENTQMTQIQVPATWNDFFKEQLHELPKTLLSAGGLILFAVFCSIAMIPIKYIVLGLWEYFA